MSVLRSAAGVQTDLRPFTSISHAPQAILKLKLTICSPTSEVGYQYLHYIFKNTFQGQKKNGEQRKEAGRPARIRTGAGLAGSCGALGFDERHLAGLGV
jgi:hypothetical protein